MSGLECGEPSKSMIQGACLICLTAWTRKRLAQFTYIIVTPAPALTFVRAGAGVTWFFGGTVFVSHCSREPEFHEESRRSDYHQILNRIPGLDPGSRPESVRHGRSVDLREDGQTPPFPAGSMTQAWALDQVQGYGLIFFSRRPFERWGDERRKLNRTPVRLTRGDGNEG